MEEQLLKNQNKAFIKIINERNEFKRKYDELYEFNSSAYVTLHLNQEVQALNFQAAKLLVDERYAIIGKSFRNFMKFHFREGWLKCVDNLLFQKNKQFYEFELHNDRVFIHIELQLLSNDSIHLTLNDITKQRQTDCEAIDIKNSLYLISNLFQRNNDAVAGLDSDLNILIFNKVFIELFSKIFATKIFVGMNFNHVLADSELGVEIGEACKKALQGQTAILLVENQTIRHENYYCYELCFDSIYNPHYQRQELVFYIRDLSKHKKQEIKLREQQAEVAHMDMIKIKSEVISAIAHEIVQPLTAIKLYSQGCIHKINQLGKPWIKELSFPLEKVISQASYAGNIIQNMKEIIKENNIKVEEIDLNQLIKDTLLFLFYERDNFNLKIELNFAKDLPLIKLDKVQMMQIILNLTRNSIEALQENNTPNPLLTIETEIKDSFILIHFIDNGPGIPEELKNKVLHSYFTTKMWGTGLGLSVCRTLIEAHGGGLSLMEPSSGQGAWFIVKLPIMNTE